MNQANITAEGCPVTEAELEAIARYSRRKLTAEEVYTFPLVLCDNDLDRDHECFTDAALEKLAVMLGVSTEEVAETIDSLERRRVILHYAPTINWDLTDRERVEAMIQVSVTPQRDMGFDAVARRIYRFEEVKSVYLMSGGYDLLVLVEAKSLKELALFVSSKLSTLEMVTGTQTSFVLKRYKEEGVIFDGSQSDNRLVVSP